MEQHFARAVDPLLVACVDLLDRAQRDEVQDISHERQKIRDAIGCADQTIRSTLRDRAEDWNIVRYVVCVWLDELLSIYPWKGKQQWTERSLQHEYFQTATGYEDFFNRARDAERLPRKDALEVCFLCVVMNFQGVYHRRLGMRTPEDLRLPGQLQDWVRDVRKYVEASRPPSPANDRAADGVDCSPLTGRYEFLKAALSLAMTSVALVIFLSCYGTGK